jgi:DNA-binding beta-propeller fold protein YncE
MPVAIGQDLSGNLLVANLFGESIGRFAPNANGNAFPLGLIQGVDTGLDFPHGVDVDAAGRIYVANQFGNTLTVYAAGASGDAVPVTTISGGATGLSGPQALAVVPPLAVDTHGLARATVGSLYRVALRAVLGTSPYRWRIVRGVLPRGLRLSRAGVLSGVPVRAGRWVFTVSVTDSSHPAMHASARLTLVVGQRRPVFVHDASLVRTLRAQLHAH